MEYRPAYIEDKEFFCKPTLIIRDEQLCHLVVMGKFCSPKNLFYVYVLTQNPVEQVSESISGCEAINQETALMGVSYNLRQKIIEQLSKSGG